MGLERELEKFVQQKQMEKCEFCHNKMKYEGAGRYRCSYCGMEALDDFGKLRKFLEENGPTPGGVIAQATGISIDKIDDFLRKGRVPEKLSTFSPLDMLSDGIRNTSHSGILTSNSS